MVPTQLPPLLFVFFISTLFANLRLMHAHRLLLLPLGPKLVPWTLKNSIILALYYLLTSPGWSSKASPVNSLLIMHTLSALLALAATLA